MENKVRKTLKNLLLYGVPLVVASFLPMKEAKGQIVKIKNPNTLYLTFQPKDLGWGMRYDFSLGRGYNYKLPSFGVYSSLSKGNCKLENEGYIKNHVKMTLGGLLYLNKNQLENSRSNLSLGLTYNTYGDRFYVSEPINPDLFNPISFEIGGGMRRKNLNAAIRIDIPKLAVAVDFGISF